MEWVSEHAIEALTAALVAVTAVYAWLTWHVVRETRQARRQSVRPYLQLYLKPEGAGVVFPTVVSTGPGTAVNVSATIEAGHHDGKSTTTVGFLREYMAEGDDEQLLLPSADGEDRGVLHLDKLVDEYRSLHLRASMQDVIGREDTVVNGIDDLGTWQANWGGQRTRSKRDQSKRTADELEKLRKLVDKIHTEHVRMRRQVDKFFDE